MPGDSPAFSFSGYTQAMTVSPPLIFFFTDFGTAGPYLGQMEGVILASSWQARVVNLIADAPSADPLHAAYLLNALAPQVPLGSILVCVVDPGVGSERRALMVESGQRIYLGPDNGLLAPIINRDPAAVVSALRYDGSTLSASFHGRDLFAPAAAELVKGQPVARESLSRDAIVGAGWPDDLAEIIYIDHYGNACTGLRAGHLSADVCLQLDDVQLHHARTFAEVSRGGLFWYENSAGLVEIACNQGRAADRLGLAIGDRVSIA